MNNVRMREFLIALDSYIGEYGYHDDETGEDVISSTEEECYLKLMDCNDFRLLTAEKTKSLIHIAFTNWEAFVAILNAFNAHA